MTTNHITPELVEAVARRSYDTGKAGVPWEVVPDATKHGLREIASAFLNDAIPSMIAAGWTPPTTLGDELWAGVEKLHALQTEQALRETPAPVLGPDCRDGKHPCAGQALNPTTDEIIPCQCTCHQENQ